MAHPFRLPAAVAGGHRETTATGRDVLNAGGNAADAATAMVLVACVAETVFTGIAGGGFAIHVDAASSTVSCLDFFVTVPGLDGRRTSEPPTLTIDFGGQPVQYAYGPGTVAVPGLPAGLEHLHRRWGSLPWRDVVEPAATLAAEGSSFSAEHSAVLDTIAPAMLLGDGATAYAPDGRYLAGGETLRHPGLDRTLRILRDEGSAPFYDGPIATAMADAVGSDGPLAAEDLRAYRVHESQPRAVEFAGHRVLSRGDDIDDLLGTLVSLGEVTESRGDIARRLVQVLRAEARRAETTNVAAVDSDGNACVVTTSLGLASGVWLGEYGLHLNSMLGESELIRGVVAPGERLGSMMSPLAVLDEHGLRLVGGAAGGSRIRSALVQVLVHVLVEDMPLTDAIGAARINPVPGVVHAEPGLPDDVVAALSGEQLSVRAARDAYFGGVSGIDRSGPGADPRRGGHAELAHR
jgi:gamma-glutamyltranspeptidase / glutathione hydrolase